LKRKITGWCHSCQFMVTVFCAWLRVVGREWLSRGQGLAWFVFRGCPYLCLSGSLFLSLSTHRLCGILEGGVPGHLAHHFPPQSGPGHRPHGAGHQPGLLPIHYSLSCQAGTGTKKPSPDLPHFCSWDRGSQMRGTHLGVGSQGPPLWMVRGMFVP
jgi:hypothetical protein